MAPRWPAAALWARQDLADLWPWSWARVRLTAPPAGDLAAGLGRAAEQP